MKKTGLILILAVCCFLILPMDEPQAWGFFAHQRINRMAVFILPSEMIGFYKKHIDYIERHAVDPDRRRYADPEEAPRHFLDSDHYGLHPFDSLPENWDRAIQKYGIDSLKVHGILPWHIARMVQRLTKAFRDENEDLILHYSAELGHYVGDAHVPLHTTQNYNGQLTGQQGIHAFWESRIPELKAETYDYFTGKALYINNPLQSAWEAVQSSYALKDSVLKLESGLNDRFPPDAKYSYENKGKLLVKVYSEAYTNAYDALLSHMVERRMLASIRLTGSLWLTAWINAGQPDLNKFGDKAVSDSLRKVHQREEEEWKQNKIQHPSGHSE